ncbi:MAG: isopentenyl phosphate kinase family protein [Thermoplasmata archaeon]|nr:isopentenyl phosphate kinase family protein [Thermoplasmata archaeon]
MDTTRPELIIVKLGGSVITRKSGAARVRQKILARLAVELASANGSPAVIVLHGAGSFGHPGAVRFGLAAPLSKGGERTRRRGAAIVSKEVRRLHASVLAALVEAGASPWSIPAGSSSRNREGKLVHFDPEPFRRAIAAGVTPVSFGDVVVDEAWGFSILSADTIAAELARADGPKRVLFVSDVPGILETASDGRRRVIPEVTDETVRQLRPGLTAPDVTGGILGKARSMREISNLGVDAGLISGLTDGALSRALRGEFVYGSWAKARPG